jgi:hypothetical protein
LVLLLRRSLEYCQEVCGFFAREQSGNLESGTGASTPTMNLALVLVVAAVVALGVILRLAVTQSLQVRRSAHLTVSIRPINIEAFRNLINPEEDEYLRDRLTAAQFRVVRRERLRAMAAYVQVAGWNATALVRIGEAALAGGDARVAEAARRLVNDALMLRRNTTVALVRIYIALAWPTSGFAAARVAERYERLNGAAMLLGRLQNPAAPVRLSAR